MDGCTADTYHALRALCRLGCVAFRSRQLHAVVFLQAGGRHGLLQHMRTCMARRAPQRPAHCYCCPAQCALHSVPCTVCPAQCALHSVPCTVCPAQCALHSVPCTSGAAA